MNHGRREPAAGLIFPSSPNPLTDDGSIRNGVPAYMQYPDTQTIAHSLSPSIVTRTKSLRQEFTLGISTQAINHPAGWDLSVTPPWSTPTTRAHKQPSHAENQSCIPVPAYKVPRSPLNSYATSARTTEEHRHSFAKPHKAPKGPRTEATPDFTSAFTRLSVEDGNQNVPLTVGSTPKNRPPRRTAHKEVYDKCCGFDQAGGLVGEARRQSSTTFPWRKGHKRTHAIDGTVRTKPRMSFRTQRALEHQGENIFWMTRALEQKERLMAKSNGNHGAISEKCGPEMQKSRDVARMAMSPLSQTTTQKHTGANNEETFRRPSRLLI